MILIKCHISFSVKNSKSFHFAISLMSFFLPNFFPFTLYFQLTQTQVYLLFLQEGIGYHGLGSCTCCCSHQVALIVWRALLFKTSGHGVQRNNTLHWSYWWGSALTQALGWWPLKTGTVPLISKFSLDPSVLALWRGSLSISRVPCTYLPSYLHLSHFAHLQNYCGWSQRSVTPWHTPWPISWLSFPGLFSLVQEVLSSFFS